MSRWLAGHWLSYRKGTAIAQAGLKLRASSTSPSVKYWITGGRPCLTGQGAPDVTFLLYSKSKCDL